MTLGNLDQAQLYWDLTKWVSETASGESEESPKPNFNISSDIFSGCLRLSTSVCALQQQLTLSQRARLAECHTRLCLWRDNVLGGWLGLCLADSPDLHRSVLDLLLDVGNALVQFVSTMLSTVSHVQGLHTKRLCQELENLLEDGSKALSILNAEDPAISSDSDESSLESDDETSDNEDRADSVLRSLQSRTQLLMKTCPALEQTLSHLVRPVKTLTAGPPIFRVSDAAQYYVRKVYDRFPKGNLGLVERLGESNWQRHCRLRADQGSSVEPRVQEQEPTVSIFHPASNFYDSALGLSLPSASKIAPSVTSHTSFASTITSDSGGKARVPTTPEAVFRGKHFKCDICHTIVSGLKNRIDWKIHVFKDLQPYICTFADCPDILLTFSTRSDWAEHEFSVHRCVTCYRCHDCHESLASEKLYLEHLTTDHRTTNLKETQGLAMIAAACEKTALPIQDQVCPLCGEVGWDSHRRFVTHVGRHMEEIALSTLPRDFGSDDESLESESEGRFETGDKPKSVGFISGDKNDLEKPFFCDLEDCSRGRSGTGFPTLRDLDRHKVNGVHDIGISGDHYMCAVPECEVPGVLWERKDIFRAHVKRRHPLHNTDVVVYQSAVRGVTVSEDKASLDDQLPTPWKEGIAASSGWERGKWSNPKSFVLPFGNGAGDLSPLEKYPSVSILTDVDQGRSSGPVDPGRISKGIDFDFTIKHDDSEAIAAAETQASKSPMFIDADLNWADAELATESSRSSLSAQGDNQQRPPERRPRFLHKTQPQLSVPQSDGATKPDPTQHQPTSRPPTARPTPKTSPPPLSFSLNIPKQETDPEELQRRSEALQRADGRKSAFSTFHFRGNNPIRHRRRRPSSSLSEPGHH